MIVLRHRLARPFVISCVALLFSHGFLVCLLQAADEQEIPTLSAPFTAEQARSAQASWAKRLNVDIEIRNTLGMTMTLIPPGHYRMGNLEPAEETAAFAQARGLLKAKAADFGDEYPPHAVRITHPFRLARCEVTRGNFRAFVNAAGYRTDAETDAQGGWGWSEEQRKFVREPRFNWRNAGFPQNDDHPVLNVSWNDAQSFCAWLSRQDKHTYRLPTEAEWEYANRAGMETRYQSGNDSEGLAGTANVADATARKTYPDWPTINSDDGFTYTSPVGSFKPNPFGICDLHGNVWEWCRDIYDAAYYENSPLADPTGPATGPLRVSRGGAWSRTTVNCRSAVRRKGAPDLRHVNIGFRPVLTLSEAGEDSQR